jgi:hypothetical protein
MALDVLRQATSITVNGRRNRQIKSARMKYWTLKYLFEFDPTLTIYSNLASSLSKMSFHTIELIKLQSKTAN